MTERKNGASLFQSPAIDRQQDAVSSTIRNRLFSSGANPVGTVETLWDGDLSHPYETSFRDLHLTAVHNGMKK